LFLLVAASSWACDALPGRPDPADRYLRPDEVKDFGALYATNCSGCHGEAGRLGPGTPVGDPLYVALATPDYLQKIIGRGVPGTSMPSFGQEAGGTLTPEQVTVLARGLGERWSSPGAEKRAAQAPPLVAPVSEAPPQSTAQVERGHRVYDQFCSRCHGGDGHGGEKAGSIVHPAYLGLVSDQGLRTTTLIGRRDLGMPSWYDVGERPMSPGEIGDVVAWMASHRGPTQ
jgi:mono/diheme cytochrome c family protein